ncbi:MAG: phenylacetate--CoA ligase family protein [Flavobacteriaceae bacterium]
MGFHKIIYELGQKLRNPSLNKWYNFLKASDSWTMEELENYQEEKLLELVSFAKNNSSFYKQKFEGIEFSNLSDLSNLPILEKEDLLEFNQDIHTHYTGKVFKAKTSGSSGTSLVFNRNEESDSFSRAAIKRGYSWYNVHPADKNLYFWGFNFSGVSLWKTRFFDFLQNRIRVFDYSAKSIKFLKKYSKDIMYISGYSSMINELSLNKEISNKHFPKLKLIKATSEEILPAYKKNIETTFRIPIISEYGATESGIIGFECPEGNVHITMEGVIVEEITDEIIVTNLHLKSFPIIRYRLGDYIDLDKETRCPCGRSHHIINSIKGRVGSKLIGINKSFPSLSIYRVFGNLSELGFDFNYQIVQKEPGKVEVRLAGELRGGEVALEKEFYKYFKNDISFTVVENFNFGKRLAKKKFFISEIDE